MGTAMKSSRLSWCGVWLGSVTVALASLTACGPMEAGRIGDEPPDRDPLKQLAASTDMPIYYLGAQFADLRYDVVVFNDGGTEVKGDLTLDPGQTVSVDYGEVCGDEYCISRFEVQTYRVGADPFRFVHECRRRPSLRGVPTVDFGPYDDGILLYTGRRRGAPVG